MLHTTATTTTECVSFFQSKEQERPVKKGKGTTSGSGDTQDAKWTESTNASHKVYLQVARAWKELTEPESWGWGSGGAQETVALSLRPSVGSVGLLATDRKRDEGTWRSAK